MAREKKVVCEEGAPRFLTTYADIVTLLMAFFVLLFAISSVDEKKFLTLLKGLEADFGNTAYQDFIIKGGLTISGANQPAGSLIPVPGGSLTIPVTQESQDAQDLEELSRLYALAEALDPNPDTSGKPDASGTTRILDLSQLTDVQDALSEVAAREGLSDAVSFRLEGRGLVVVLSTDDILFQSGSAELSPGKGTDLLEAMARVLATFDNPILVEGHTDNQPLHGSYTNWNLSVDRAVAVVRKFEEEFGIPANRLVASGYADQRPIADNSTEEGRARNRRVELVIAVSDLLSEQQVADLSAATAGSDSDPPADPAGSDSNPADDPAGSDSNPADDLAAPTATDESAATG